MPQNFFQYLPKKQISHLLKLSNSNTYRQNQYKTILSISNYLSAYNYYGQINFLKHGKASFPEEINLKDGISKLIILNEDGFTEKLSILNEELNIDKSMIKLADKENFELLKDFVTIPPISFAISNNLESYTQLTGLIELDFSSIQPDKSLFKKRLGKRLLISAGISDPFNLAQIILNCLYFNYSLFILNNNRVTGCNNFHPKILNFTKGLSLLLNSINGTLDDLDDIINHNKFSLLVAEKPPISNSDYFTLNNSTITVFPRDGINLLPNQLIKDKSNINIALVMGSEHHGINQTLPKPNYGIGINIKNIESLNVASAAAILIDHLKL